MLSQQRGVLRSVYRRDYYRRVEGYLYTVACMLKDRNWFVREELSGTLCRDNEICY